MTEFQEVDARLGGMHGYVTTINDTSPEQRGATQADVQRLEAKVDALAQVAVTQAAQTGALTGKVEVLIKALQAGAIGKWTP